VQQYILIVILWPYTVNGTVFEPGWPTRTIISLISLLHLLSWFLMTSLWSKQAIRFWGGVRGWTGFR